MRIFQGKASSGGIVIAPVHRFFRGLPPLPRTQHTPAEEKKRLLKAVEIARKELTELIEQADTKDNREILEFHRLLLDDENMRTNIFACIEEGMGAADAVEKVGRTTSELFFNMAGNEYMRLRGVDVQDVYMRIVDILDGRKRWRRNFSTPEILASEYILPSDIASAPKGSILGIVTSEGSYQSHACIIARSLGIPVITELGADFLAVCDGHTAAMDADAGVITLDPDAQTYQSFVRRICERQSAVDSYDEVRSAPCITADGEPFSLFAVGFTPEDIRLARRFGASAMGVLKTENLLMRGYVPGEEEQFEFYKECLQAAGGMMVCVRTFDMESDLSAGLLMPQTLNPELGMRGIRYTLAHPEMFTDQLCALLRAGVYGSLAVMFPMVATPDDWKRAMECVANAKRILQQRGVPYAGNVMFGITLETPSSCLEADAYPPLGCEFFAVGLNDLVQYTYAASRADYEMVRYFQNAGPAIIRLIQMVKDVSDRTGIPFSLNGLALNNTLILEGALKLGVRTFAVDVQRLPQVKQALCAARTKDEN